MKILHCADLHLDSKLETNLSREQAKERKAEILNSFVNMVTYAAQNGIEIILIAGDLFDKRNISATARNTVINMMEDNPQINFYYLKGNHDSEDRLSNLNILPDNLRMFTNEWTTYVECDGRLAITGTENNLLLHSLVLDTGRYNIVMLHGQTTEADLEHQPENINLKHLRNRGIDYLALGHVHAYRVSKLDPRGMYGYPGCLEGRGFDECGEHGFIVLDIDLERGSCSTEFIPFAKRRLFYVEADITECQSTIDMLKLINEKTDILGCCSRDMIKVVLCGEPDVECEKNADFIFSALKDSFYFVKISDETKLRVDPENYRFDTSLKGEFVRSVLADDSISAEDRPVIIRYGLQALMGEEVQ